MIKKIYFVIVFLIIAVNGFGQSNQAKKLNKTIKVATQAKCYEKEGYWYKEKCWANFKEFDEGINTEDIDRIVVEQLALLNNYGVTVENKTYPINFFITEEIPEDNLLIIITVYTDEKGEKSILNFARLKNVNNKKFETKSVVILGDIIKMTDQEVGRLIENSKLKGEFKATLVNPTDTHIELVGTIHNEETGKTQQASINIGDAIAGMGDTTLEVKGDKAYLNGTLGTKGYIQFKDLIKNHPEVTTVVLQDVPGSINDAVNMHTGRIIREAGLNTLVLADSKISSGGVDLFCAGKERIVTQGAKLGIHSWGGDGISADDLSKNHPAHQYQIEYFTMCLGKTIGPDFYFRTLSAAPAGQMHWMKDKEIKEKVATKFIIE